MRDAAGPGHVVAGRYRLLDQIGHGAMGTVWRARDELLHRDVAVKEVTVLPALSPADRGAAYQRTLREAKTAARLSHPGVVTVFDVAEEDGRPWIIMELVRARSLDRVLTEDGPLPPARVAGIGQQLLGALAAAHAAGVLHRDVKPSNVLLCPDGRAVLTDFGIATLEGDTRLTQTGMVMGTPAFTAPERIRGEPATPASDLWSLGATLYAAVQGRGPYTERGGAMTTMNAVINEDAPAAPSAGALGPVIAALMRKDPAGRPDVSGAARLLAGVVSAGAGRVPQAAAWAGPGRQGESGLGPGAARGQPGSAPAGTRGQPGSAPAASYGQPGPVPAGTRDQPGPAPAGTRDQPGPAPAGTRGYPAAWGGGAGGYPPGGMPYGAPVAADWPQVSPAEAWPPAAGGDAGDPSAGARPSRRRGRGVLAVGVALVIVAAGITGGLALAHYLRSSRSPGPGSSPAAGSSSGGAALAPLPAGYAWYSLPAASSGTAAGFRMAVPSGWPISRDGLITYVRNPSGAGFLEVDLTPHTFPGELAEARWLQRRTLQQGKFPGYQRIALRPVSVHGSPGAVWAFSWLEAGAGRVVAQDYLFNLAAGGGSQSYAVYGSAPVAAWPQTSQALSAAIRTFQPVS